MFDDAEHVKLVALVVLADAAAAGDDLEGELRSFCREGLAPYKDPRWIGFIEKLPKTATDKVQRCELRA